MTIILLIINGLYFIFNLVLIFTWLKLIKQKPLKVSEKDTKLTVIVPVRNEAANIVKLLEGFERQDYPYQNFEVIIANDGSTDDTADLVLAFQETAKYTLRIINIFEEKGTSPKKRAIQKGIEIAWGELILTTDGDCSVSKNWLSSVQQFYKSTDAKFISSAVTFEDEKSFWNTAQIIEFASLIGSGACAMELKKPNMCNGANVAYTREAFENVGGFAGNEHLASGDDEFLMHKIFEKYPNKVLFNVNADSIVKTKSQPDSQHFYQQRKRWASKWKHYKNWQISALAVFVFLVNLGVIITYFYLPSMISLIVLSLKFSAEFFFLSLIIKYLVYSKKIFFIPIIQIFYPFYVIFFGLISQVKGYEWKGRKLQ
jgi:cellulose synthase/poly-beta-1,6-N-acetylglucosamine synthase-like glycosyltransferase